MGIFPEARAHLSQTVVFWPSVVNLLMFVCVFAAVFRPYAMPSAGFLPFLQTVMCDLGDDDKGGVVSDLPSFPNAT